MQPIPVTRVSDVMGIGREADSLLPPSLPSIHVYSSGNRNGATRVKTKSLVICSRRKSNNLTHCWSILSFCQLKDLSVFSCPAGSRLHLPWWTGPTLQFLMTEFKREIRWNVSVSMWGVFWVTLFDPEGRKF